MLNLLRSDLYRMTRLRGLRGALWQYLLLMLGLAVLEVGLNAFVIARGGAGMAALDPARDLATPTAFLGPALYGNVSVVGIASTFGMIEYLLYDLGDGFAKSLVSSLSSRLAYFAEKAVLAGAWSAAMIAAAAAFHLACFGLFLGLPLGLSFAGTDGAAELALWLLGTWASTWALTMASMAFALAVRKKLPSYVFTFTLVMGFVPMLVATAGLLAGENPALAPVASALNALAAWMPSTVIQALGHGAAGMLSDVAALSGATGAGTWLCSILAGGATSPLVGSVPTGLWAAAVGAAWTAACSALFAAVAGIRAI